ncbi:MAG TPA: hypothetical protein VKB73_03095 [Gaiellaceae bacterium]|nr:hypothetical protein [Gaiellaceae bacterium]
MRTLSALIAVFSLVSTAALVAMPGGVLLAFFTFGLFAFALPGVFGENRTVRQHDPTVNPRAWRDGENRECDAQVSDRRGGEASVGLVRFGSDARVARATLWAPPGGPVPSDVVLIESD